jgi:hypothetical protein
MGDQIRVNGNQFSWGSIILKVKSERIYGLTSVAFADKRERSYAYGMGRHHGPRGRSLGKYTPDPVKLGGWKRTIQDIRELLASASLVGETGYGDTQFEVDVQYIEPDEATIQVVIEGCVWTGSTTSDEESPDPLKEEFECSPMLIRRNGLVLFDPRDAI